MTNQERRERFKQGLSVLYVPMYDALCKELGPDWAPFYGLRTMDEQAFLWSQGRSRPGRKVTNAKPGQSPHNYGCASDWTLFIHGKPIWDHDRWGEYEAACEKFGIKWGGDFGDKPHNELPIDCSWAHIGVSFAQGGLRKALEHVEEAWKSGLRK